MMKITSIFCTCISRFWCLRMSFDTPFTTCSLSLVNIMSRCSRVCILQPHRHVTFWPQILISLAIDLNSFTLPTINSIYCKKQAWEHGNRDVFPSLILSCSSSLVNENAAVSIWCSLLAFLDIQSMSDGWGVQLYSKEISSSCFKAIESLYHSDPQEPAERLPMLT